MKTKNRLSFWEIWNMSFGFLGIQFGFALQGGFMTRIFQTLGAEKDDIPMLWIAAPLTGLLVQPIIGFLSDHTWHPRWGRRRPYFLIGAILSSIALLFVPNSPALWVAAGLLWVLDASINISMEPFRALVADKLPESQRSYGFVVQTLIIGIGTWVASNLPWLVSELGVSDSAPSGVVPMSVKIAFGIGAVVFLASILYTVFTTTEYPPEDMKVFDQEKKNAKNTFLKDIVANIGAMPVTMRKLGVIQFFSWFAFFAMWSMANPALTEHVYHSPDPSNEHYAEVVKSGNEAHYEKGFIKLAATDSTFFSSAIVDSVFVSYKAQGEFLVDFYGLPTKEDKEQMLSAEKAVFVPRKVYASYAGYEFQQASNGVGSHMGMYGLSSMAFALLLTIYTSKRRINRKRVHMFSLILGGIGFILMYFATSPDWLIASFILIGFAWGSILSMPYAMLSSSIDPKKMGMFMGIFNMFIVIPQIIASLGGVNFLYKLFGEETIYAMVVAGISLIVAGLCNLLITEKSAISYQSEDAI
ncbi:MAG: maltose/moltooligosaccharide transporter [Flavobacteriales bacterium]|jgi:maltose/moltooligosaccharide transporter